MPEGEAAWKAEDEPDRAGEVAAEPGEAAAWERMAPGTKVAAEPGEAASWERMAPGTTSPTAR